MQEKNSLNNAHSFFPVFFFFNGYNFVSPECFFCNFINLQPTMFQVYSGKLLKPL